ncbi:MAG: hypothetical protein A3C55_06410 [Gammaproteobacteria bacterium RIFCSPHIGHO2_02_FULL_42_13]|nr:MAG: hypothetical protein A3C55_06410 [Gammaproteobacteria bacterium RIFCSPHIGHO2_02_FULL_42_13]OGT67551.1 MAG: hypothetical protein A3H43_05660 [Gammaproteobacteria bacterium RIFCSPLOWO2_02_FULL_42_9]
MTPTQKKPTQNINSYKTHAMTGFPQLRAAQSLKNAMKQAMDGMFLQQHNMYLSFINPPPTGHNADSYWQHHPHISHKMPLPHVANHNSRLRQPASERQPGARWSQ